MRIEEVRERTPLLAEQLLEIWERSVRATHLFLSGPEMQAIKREVPQAIGEIPHLVIAGEGRPVGFMGVDGQTLAMLFLAPEARGTGLGRRLLQYGIERYAVRELTVNAQNPAAVGFYEHMGFRVCRRTERDGQGRPYPLLYMELA